MTPEIAVIVLGQQSVAVARRFMQVLPNAKLYGLSGRTHEVDVNFDRFGDTVRDLFRSGTAIVGICAAGILIRTIAPLLSDKRAEPPVLAIAEDGSAVVPLLGGLNGVNDLARQIAAVLQIQAAITTTGEIRFGTVLENPPPGYCLSNPDYAKSFTSDLLAGATVRIDGTVPWLSSLPIDSNSELTIQITERSQSSTPKCLIYHRKTIIVCVNQLDNSDVEDLIDSIAQSLIDANLAVASIAGIFARLEDANQIEAIAHAFDVPARFFRSDPSRSVVTLTDAMIVKQDDQFTIAIAPQIIDPTAIGQARGKLSIIGTGPGSPQWMSPEVKVILDAATDLVGYTTYLNLLGSLSTGKQRHDSDNREEEARAKFALDLAAEGRSVVVVSSGDPGIYAMATAIFEVFDRYRNPDWDSIDIRVAPGISAMQAAAAAIGAPLGHDFCAISLSDILKPWHTIAHRIRSAAEADFAIAFYNPISSQRTWQLVEAKGVLLEIRDPATPVVLARNLGRSGEAVKVITLEQLTPELADMRTVILVGSSKTRRIDRANGSVWVYTPRRYDG